jgi:hypothetical protein
VLICTIGMRRRAARAPWLGKANLLQTSRGLAQFAERLRPPTGIGSTRCFASTIGAQRGAAAAHIQHDDGSLVHRPLRWLLFGQ